MDGNETKVHFPLFGINSTFNVFVITIIITVRTKRTFTCMCHNCDVFGTFFVQIQMMINISKNKTVRKYLL